ncbi:MAG TPA: hypothetical protein VL588_02425 [Bdellovibrionota bacterium]|nr:hypothetical protein [Bdellovibrionota bacterium]
MKRILATAVALSLTLSISAFGGDEHAMPMPKSNPKFDQLKQLVGTWEGKTKMGDKETTVKATYELTSGGSAILERLFAGTDHEMVSVYHADGSSVAMTHYCMLGNHPTMKLKKSDDHSMAFEMSGKDGIHQSGEMHMHALNISWNNPTHMTEEWVSYNQGKKQDSKMFEFIKQ